MGACITRRGAWAWRPPSRLRAVVDERGDWAVGAPEEGCAAVPSDSAEGARADCRDLPEVLKRLICGEEYVVGGEKVGDGHAVADCGGCNVDFGAVRRHQLFENGVQSTPPCRTEQRRVPSRIDIVQKRATKRARCGRSCGCGCCCCGCR